ncbi:hypothetical protein [Nocardioides sp. Leaf307]|uniref:hypothetical protein n=1 Tax=Nocardioides sp. Leaf307 TaxID=1736331 RepID=UPI0012EAFF9A|nr:hypothetical protein [Nocardioides sp. Leaf307]
MMTVTITRDLATNEYTIEVKCQDGKLGKDIARAMLPVLQENMMKGVRREGSKG